VFWRKEQLSSRPERFTTSGYGADQMHTGLYFVTFASGQP